MESMIVFHSDIGQIGGIPYLNITQEELYKKIAAKGDVDETTVRNIFHSAETIIFAYLTSAVPSENVQVKLLNGLSLNSTYVPERTVNKGVFQNYKCADKIKVKANITKYYIAKINERR